MNELEVGKAKKPSLDTISAKAENLVVRLNQIYDSLDYVANGGKPSSTEASDKATLKDTPHVQQIDDTLSRAQNIIGSCENLLAKIRFG